MFSDRLWRNKQALLFHVRETITQGVMQGTVSYTHLDVYKRQEQHIFAQLQYEVLNCKDAAKLYGIKGAPYGARDLTVSLDALVETGVQFLSLIHI